MTRGEVQSAVIAFLDQFIERGAGPDVHALRERLAVDPGARQLLDSFIPNDHPQPTEREAFDAMKAFFAAEWERSGRQQYTSPPGLVMLISWTRWEAANEKGHFDEAGFLEMTGDPAQWHDWLASVAVTKR